MHTVGHMKVFVGALLSIALFFCLAVAVVYTESSDAFGRPPAIYAARLGLGAVIIIGLSSLAIVLRHTFRRSTGAKE